MSNHLYLMLHPTFTLHGSHVSQLSSDILLIKFSTNAVTQRDIVDIGNLRRQIIGNCLYFPIIDLTDNDIILSTLAKTWLANNPESAKLRLIDLVLCNSKAKTLEINHYNRNFQPQIPIIPVNSLDQAYDLIARKKLEITTSIEPTS